MTSFKNMGDAFRDGQDSTERHAFQEMKFGPAGASVGVKGNGTEDDDCAVLAIGGTIMHLPKGTNAEVLLLSGGDDNNAKFAVILGPRDKQYQSQPGEAWTQDPMNPNRRVGFDADGVQLVSDGIFKAATTGKVRVASSGDTVALGTNGSIEVDKDGKVWMRGQWYFETPPIAGTKPFNP
jgi:hypothetical protein